MSNTVQQLIANRTAVERNILREAVISIQHLLATKGGNLDRKYRVLFLQAQHAVWQLDTGEFMTADDIADCVDCALVVLEHLSA